MPSLTPSNDPSANSGDGRHYWRSLDQLADTPQFCQWLEREFPAGASELFQGSRRRFLKLMGASLALAGLGGCMRWPEEKLEPYAHRPNNRTPGVPVSYATAMELGGIAQGLLVTSYDGRPIKVEGNPSHPLNQGAADAIAQASVLQLYDPDRSRGVIRRAADGTRSKVGWEEFARWAKGAFHGDGKRICVLSEASSSPSLIDMRSRFQKALPDALWLEYEPLWDGIRQGTRGPFGLNYAPRPDGSPQWESHSKPLHSVLELSKAKVIVSLDADLFGDGNPLAIKYARDFAAGRCLDEVANDQMNRLYVVESTYSTTGACADHRRALRPSAIERFVGQLAHAFGVKRFEGDVPESGIDEAFLQQIKTDLEANRGQSILVAGPRQNYNVRSTVAEINRKLGNVDKTVVYYPDLHREYPYYDSEALGLLTGVMGSGDIDVLLILSGNPAYDSPVPLPLRDLPFGELLKKVKNTVHLGLYDDETSQLCDWHLSQAHYLESWGDARTYDGTVSIVQPLIEPLFDGKSPIEVLAMILDDKSGIDGYEIVRRTFRSLVGESETEWKWKKSLADGVVDGTAWKSVPLDEPPTDSVGWALPTNESSQSPAVGNAHSTENEVGNAHPTEYELVFFSDGKVYDGRFANNGWLQELPDPMTRLTWDNAALMSPKTAETIGVTRDELVAIEAEGCPEVEIAAFFVPGMPDGVIAIALGYGRTAAGNIGTGVGKNAYLLRRGPGEGWRAGVKARPTGRSYPLATVQDHHIVDQVGKEAVQERIPVLIKEGTLAEYQADPSLGSRKVAPISIFDEHLFNGGVDGHAEKTHVPSHDFHRWGMAVDLTACTGCGACVVACQAENNIPIVGKEQVLHGREMHWIRVDRYFRETPEKPVAVHQPVLCMHCENAPCEEVCPFAATTHSEEGINMMTYNRCVGTRYCSNNCPYKVRRFNFFDYNRGTLKDLYEPNLTREPISELLKMQKNPDVTVRMRGVMEKCTYCIQRIEQARITAKREADRPLLEGEIQTACQQTCPAQAIVFGDLNDPNSRVSKLQSLPRTYGMLNPELNTKPRTQYVAKVRNLAPGLDEAS